MSVTIDHEQLAAGQLGLSTVGEVLSYVQKDNRLVVQVLIDGQEPSLDAVGELRSTKLMGHTIYIETADPRKLAMEVLDEVAQQMGDAERMKEEAAGLLQQNQTAKAMEQLGGCIRTWQNAQEAISKTAQLLRVDTDALLVDGEPMAQMAEAFSEQLRQIRSALEQRDFVALGDVLTYEMVRTSERWVAAIHAVRSFIAGLK